MNHRIALLGTLLPLLLAANLHAQRMFLTPMGVGPAPRCPAPTTS